MEYFSEFIKNFRFDNNLSTEDLAKLLEVDVRKVEMWESNNETPSNQEITKLLKIFEETMKRLRSFKNNIEYLSISKMPITSFILGILIGIGAFIYIYYNYYDYVSDEPDLSKVFFNASISGLFALTFSTQVLFRSSLSKLMIQIVLWAKRIPPLAYLIETKSFIGKFVFNHLLYIALVIGKFILYVYMIAIFILISPITYIYELLKLLINIKKIDMKIKK